MTPFVRRWLYRLMSRSMERQEELENLYPCSCRGCHFDCGGDICWDRCWLWFKVEDDGPRLCYKTSEEHGRNDQ